MIEIIINTEYIKLDQFLKLADISQTGGHGKIMILDGLVKVNGETTLQRGKKLYDNDTVQVEDSEKFIVRQKV